MNKTLDAKHNQKMMSFTENKIEIKNLKNKLKSLNQEIINASGEQVIKMKDQILDIQDQIKQLKRENEIDYLVDTSDILFKYYGIIENGSGNEENIAMNNTKMKNSILKYLMTPNIDEKENVEVVDRASLLEKYMSYTDLNFFKEVDASDHKDQCSCCNSTNIMVMMNEGLIICNECNIVEHIIVDHDRPSYKDPPREVTYFSYKRVNHFNEWISQIQGKETTDIPEEVYDNILLEIKKQKITNMASLTPAKVKEILKKLKNNKYYEHVPHIINKLNGLPAPHFYPELENKLRMMFRQIQPLFLKYAPSSRKNFLSYSYVLHKFVQLLGKDEYLPYFPLLKNREKLHHQEMIWKKICEELNWEYLASM